MSGIYGLLRKDGAPVEPNTLHNMQSAMEEWGPDDHGCWHEGNFGMGFLLMHNTPESFFEQQPIQDSSNSRVVLAADARIDNRDELCETFRIPTAERETLPDSQLMMMAYKKWGEDCPKHLLGAYAFAVWDCREQRLFLVRDHMGFRPLYMYEDRQKFVFASDVRAVLAVEGVPQDLDQDMVAAARMQYTKLLREKSLYQDIYKLLPAHSLTSNRQSTKKTHYWHYLDAKKVRLSSNEEYAEQMNRLVQEAIGCRLRSAFPIGSHLSGGLDSSSITVLASRLLRKRGDQLTGIFSWSPPPEVDGDQLTDERRHIELICQLEQLSCTYTQLSTEDIFTAWQSDIRYKPLSLMHHEVSVCRQAESLGVRTLLSGWGGDEFATFNGRGYFSHQLLYFQWRKLLIELYKRRQVRGTSYRSSVINDLILPLIPKSLYQRRPNLLPRELREIPQVSAKEHRYLRLLFIEGRNRATKEQNHINALTNGWLLNRIESWMVHALPARIEYRYPLLDRRLLEFCIGLPMEQFVQNGWSRFIFRKAMTDVLPESICWLPNIKVEESITRSAPLQVRNAYKIFLKQFQSGQLQLNGVFSMSHEHLTSD
ncbi:MAG: asparagine synthase-related protein [Chloroflexota bacterium]